MRTPTNPKKALWKIFSEYIRRKDSDIDGRVACISCGVLKHWKELHAGHYIPKSLGLAIYFEERNVHPQCAGCNTFRHGNLSEYAVALIEKYGNGILEELQAQKNRARKISKIEYLDLIEEYKLKLEAVIRKEKSNIFGAR